MMWSVVQAERRLKESGRALSVIHAGPASPTLIPSPARDRADAGHPSGQGSHGEESAGTA